MKTIHWNVDTQYDFMRNDKSYKGKLPVEDARGIEATLAKLTKYAREHSWLIVNTADWHNEETQEISDEPDYKTTFPEHCMQGTKGARFVPATRPKNPYVIDWQNGELDEQALNGALEIVLNKDHFDIFQGNKHADRVVEILDPDRVIVYGVATNVCVHYAVEGLLKRGKQVYVITDAIKELPGLPLEQLLQEWREKGAKLITSKQYLKHR